MKILLIGHGYLGQAIAQEFRQHGCEVIATSLTGSEGTLACDVSCLEEVARLPRCERMVHCAASGRGGAEAYQKVYADGCRHLIATFPGVPLLFTSSTSVYGQTDGSWVTETSAASPDRETGKILLEAESIVLTANGWVTRLAGIYGPARSVILRNFLTNQAVLEEDGRRFLNQIHRDDAARAIVQLVLAGISNGNIFNLSDSHPLSQLDCYQALAKMLDFPMPLSGPRDLNRKRGWTHKRVSNEKLRNFGWNPRFSCFLDAVPGLISTISTDDGRK